MTSVEWPSPGQGMTIGAESFILGVFLAIMVLFAVTGNLLVIVAVITDRHLRHTGNYFVVSLALADTLVAMTVMTFALVNDVTGTWLFGSVVCRLWLSADVMCSTASILNLCAISLDRYIHIRSPLHYELWVTHYRALLAIGTIWIMSALISFLPIHLGWHHLGDDDDDVTRHDTFSHLINISRESSSRDMDVRVVYNISPSLDRTGVIQSQIPVVELQSGNSQSDIIFYERLSIGRGSSPDVESMFEADSVITSRPAYSLDQQDNESNVLSHFLVATSFSNLAISSRSEPDSNARLENLCLLELNRLYAVLSSAVSFYVPCLAMIFIYYRLHQYASRQVETIKNTYKYAPPKPLLSLTLQPNGRSSQQVQSLNPGNKMSDHKAALTLGIIMGVFLICWAPFFTINVIGAFYSNCIPTSVYAISVWLGYANSTMNPVIYSVFNRQFRDAFKRVLSRTCCWDRHNCLRADSKRFQRPVNGRKRTETSWHDEYVMRTMRPVVRGSDPVEYDADTRTGSRSPVITEYRTDDHQPD